MFTRKVAAVVLPVTVAAAGLVVLAQAHRPMAVIMRRISAPSVPLASHRAPLAASRMTLDAQRTFGTPVTYHNLTLLPVYDANATPSDAYITLDEGLKAKTVRVQESSEGGTVNTLYVTNMSRKPLYLLGGEVVLGGQQDRAISRDILVAAGKKHVPITVFCVEHGRWTGHGDFDRSAQSVASADIRLGAQDGEFAAEHQVALANTLPPVQAGLPASSGPVNAYGVVGTPPLVARQTENANPAIATSRSLRMTGTIRPDAPAIVGRVSEPLMTAAAVSASSEVGNAQQQVWAKVAAKNTAFKAASDTGTYRNVLNMSLGDASKSAPAYVKALTDRLGQDPHLVGVVAAVNGRVVATDIFSDPVLFQKLWPKLLRSYAADAVEHTPGPNAHDPSVTPTQARAFYMRATSSKTKSENKSEAGASVRLDAPDATTYRLMPSGSYADGHAAPVPLHETVLHK